MAESLGRATFELDLDAAAFRAGLDQAKRDASTAGQTIEQSFTRTGKPIQTAANGLKFFTDEQGRARAESGRFLSVQEKLAAGIENTGNAARGAGSAFGRGIFGDLASAVGVTVGFAGLAIGIKDAVQAAVEFESITRKLQNTLGSGGAAEALAFTKGLADQLGLSYKQLSSDFGSFTAAASASGIPLKEQEAVFAAVAKAGQSLGLSGDAVTGSLVALQQIASKGVVSMEELRQQLGERLPIAFSAAAQGLGITQQQLNKLVESGQLTAQEFFPALAKGLNELTAGSGGVETSAQSFQKLANAWEDLQIKLGETLIPTVTESVQGLTGALQFAAENTKTLVQVLAGVGSAAAAFYLIANATKAAAIAQKALAVSAAIAQTILNPANAAKVAIALGVGAATAAAVGKALDDATGSQKNLTKEADLTKKKLIEANAAALKGATAAQQAEAKVRNEKLATLSAEKLNLQAQEKRLGAYQQEYNLVGQINKVRSDAAIGRSDTIKSLLDQELAQAQKLATNDAQRRALELQFGQAKFNQTVAEFDLKARALVTEQQGQQAALAFEQQKNAAAGQRAEIEARIALLQAQSRNAEKGSAETQQQVALAQQNLDLIRQTNAEELGLGNLRSQLLQEQQAAQRDQLSQQRLIALNAQAEFGSVEQQARLQADVNAELRNQAGYANAAAVSAQNFKAQLQGAADARGDLSTAFQAQVNTVIDGSQQFTTMNNILSTIATNTAKQPVVNVTVNNSGARGNSSGAVVSGTSG